MPAPIEDRRRRIALIDTEVGILDRESAGRRETRRRGATTCWPNAHG